MELDQMRENGILSAVRAFGFQNLNCSGAPGAPFPAVTDRRYTQRHCPLSGHLRFHTLRFTNYE